MYEIFLVYADFKRFCIFSSPEGAFGRKMNRTRFNQHINARLTLGPEGAKGQSRVYMLKNTLSSCDAYHWAIAVRLI